MNYKGAAMTRYEAIEKALRQWAELEDCGCVTTECEGTCLPALSRAALALPEDSKTVNAELYDLAFALADSAARSDIECMAERHLLKDSCWYTKIPSQYEYVDLLPRALRYLELRESSGEPMPYKVIRDGDKVRFL